MTSHRRKDTSYWTITFEPMSLKEWRALSSEERADRAQAYDALPKRKFKTKNDAEAALRRLNLKDAIVTEEMRL